jgi:cyclophilin family peptidyl-prolyl cis-trans isomerase
VIAVEREWAPLAADRFYNLVKNGFYNGTRFFRVSTGSWRSVACTPTRTFNQRGGRRTCRTNRS